MKPTRRPATGSNILPSLVTMGDADNYGRLPWAGEFILESHLNVVATQVEKETTAPGWPLLEGGAFGGDVDQAKAAREALHAWIANVGSFDQLSHGATGRAAL